MSISLAPYGGPFIYIYQAGAQRTLGLLLCFTAFKRHCITPAHWLFLKSEEKQHSGFPALQVKPGDVQTFYGREVFPPMVEIHSLGTAQPCQARATGTPQHCQRQTTTHQNWEMETESDTKWNQSSDE